MCVCTCFKVQDMHNYLIVYVLVMWLHHTWRQEFTEGAATAHSWAGDRGSFLQIKIISSDVVHFTLPNKCINCNSTTFWLRRSSSGRSRTLFLVLVPVQNSFVCSWQRPTWPKPCISCYWFCYVTAENLFARYDWGIIRGKATEWYPVTRCNAYVQ